MDMIILGNHSCKTRTDLIHAYLHSGKLYQASVSLGGGGGGVKVAQQLLKLQLITLLGNAVLEATAVSTMLIFLISYLSIWW